MKSGILIIDKDKDKTSRDVVNELCKKLGTKKIGHTGTLDPIATGVLVLCVNEGTKVIEFLTSDTKEYIATVKLGIETDTLDITGNIINTCDVKLTIDDINNALLKFKGEYLQEVPKYSAVHVDGKRLYEYARSNIDVELPKRLVNIINIELLEFKDDEFKFKVLVSKGTYIRSLINDIGKFLNVCCTMKDLRRVKQGIFDIKDAISVSDAGYDKLISINKSMSNYPEMTVSDSVAKKIRNGCKIEGHLDNLTRIVDSNNNLLALYANDTNNNLIRSVRIFNGD